MLYMLKQPATPEQINDMLTVYEDIIKIAVDIRKGILVGGGEMHVDCEAM